MQGIEIHSVIFDVDIWCDCGNKFKIFDDGTSSSRKCPICNAEYDMLPARVDGE